MSPQKLRVGVILGGRSGEHEVSLRSAQSGETPAAPADSSLIPRHESLRSVDVVFPVLHGPYGEDGTVQGLLELAHIPYVGCGVLASALAMDKAACKAVFAAAGLPQLPFLLVQRRRWENEPEQVLADVESRLTYPLFAKPANLGSSVGVSKATQRTELARALDQAARYDRRLLVEQGIDAREIEVSVLGNDDPIASVPGEIVPQREFYDYAAKYLDPGSELIIPAPLSPGLAEAARQMAVQAFLAIDGAGMARVDFLLERRTGQLYLSEVNTIPGFTSISMYPKLWEASGLSYPALIDRLIELALERYADKSRTVTSYRHGLEA
jgi:D-alanine-D-alanine ligase